MSIVFFAGLIVTLVTCIPVIWQLRNHPRGLVVLFLTEMWERFSYYGMRGLLIFYLTEQFLFSDKAAAAQYGAYTTLVYLLPLIGGIVADRYLGTRKAVAFGALLLVCGHLTMAVEGPPAVQVLRYHGHTYNFTSDGRGADRHVRLQVGGAQYDYAPGEDGALLIYGEVRILQHVPGMGETDGGTKAALKGAAKAEGMNLFFGSRQEHGVSPHLSFRSRGERRRCRGPAPLRGQAACWPRGRSSRLIGASPWPPISMRRGRKASGISRARSMVRSPSA